MKKILFGFVLILVAQFGFAQNDQDYLEVARDVLKTEKKAAIAEVMQLTPAESGPFWALYEEYNSHLYKIDTRFLNMIRSYAQNYGNMNDELAKRLWTEAVKVETERLKLKKKYFKKFSKILSPTKTLRYFQAENKIKAMIDAKLAMDIPMLGDQ